MGKQADVISIIQILKCFCKFPVYSSSFTTQAGSQDLIQYHQEQQWKEKTSLSHSRFGLKERGQLAVIQYSTTELVKKMKWSMFKGFEDFGSEEFKELSIGKEADKNF
jgi:hypothetical protein